MKKQLILASLALLLCGHMPAKSVPVPMPSAAACAAAPDEIVQILALAVEGFSQLLEREVTLAELEEAYDSGLLKIESFYVTGDPREHHLLSYAGLELLVLEPI